MMPVTRPVALPLHLVGGHVLMPDGALERRDVHVADGLIADTPSATAHRLDCQGCVILPGIVDVHGDAFELELYPRPGVAIDFTIAMGSIDRQLVTNGITTGFHGLTVSWEPGARSLDAADAFMMALPAERPHLMADHRVQLRWEVFAHGAIASIARWLDDTPVPSIAFNDHTTATLASLEAGDRASFERWARRAGTSLDQYLTEAEAVAERVADVPARIAQVAGLGRERGAVLLAHDEADGAMRARHRDLGIRVSEFPLTLSAAADAVVHGEHVVLGAPNVLRGGSHKGMLSAEEAIREGACTILASDYYYPSMIHAAERLVARGVLGLAAAWALVSANPAAAMGFEDRGAVQTGGRADLAVIAMPDAGSGSYARDRWRLVHTLAAGHLVSLGHWGSGS